MATKKAFDCVRIKNEAQAKLREDLAGLTAEEGRDHITRELGTSDSIVAVKWQSLREGCTASKRARAGIRR